MILPQNIWSQLSNSRNNPKHKSTTNETDWTTTLAAWEKQKDMSFSGNKYHSFSNLYYSFIQNIWNVVKKLQDTWKGKKKKKVTYDQKRGQ